MLTVPTNNSLLQSGAAFKDNVTLVTGGKIDIQGALTTVPGSAASITLKHADKMTVESTGSISSDGAIAELGAGAVVLNAPVTSNNAPIGFTGSTTAVNNLTLSAGTSTVTFNGPVSPGLSGPGKLNITGNLAFSSTGKYLIDIVNATPGNFDQIVTTGTVTAGGSIGGTAAGGIQDSDLFPVILNGSASPVINTFAGIPQLGVAKVGGTFFTVTYLGGDNNDIVLNLDHAPTIQSASVAPTPLDVGTAATVTVMDTDPDHNPLTTTFDYGDGVSDNTGVHIYTAPGDYTVTVTVSDGGLTAQIQLPVEVIGGQKLRVTLTANIGPAGADSDKLTLTGYLHIPPKTSLAGLPLVLQIGENTETFTLNKAGAAKSSSGNAHFAFIRPNARNGGDTQFRLTISKADLQSLIAVRPPPPNENVTVTIQFNGNTIQSTFNAKLTPHGARITAVGAFPQTGNTPQK